MMHILEVLAYLLAALMINGFLFTWNDEFLQWACIVFLVGNVMHLARKIESIKPERKEKENE